MIPKSNTLTPDDTSLYFPEINTLTRCDRRLQLFLRVPLARCTHPDLAKLVQAVTTSSVSVTSKSETSAY